MPEEHAKAGWRMRHGIKPGDIGYVTYLHGIIYAKECGYDQAFEAYVADGLANFVKSYDPEKDRIWLAEVNGQIVGSIAIVSHSETDAQLRWFLVHPDYRGRGIGERLIETALEFCKQRKCRTVFLWTTSELKAAGHLYARFGFRKTEEKTHEIWGKNLTEEKYELPMLEMPEPWRLKT